MWQWIHHHATLADGRTITEPLVREILDQETARIRAQVGDAVWAKGRPDDTRTVLEAVTLSEDFPAFLTLPAYQYLD